ncbi:MAG: VOC family protein [Myxococcota bacterium]|nr:VOC family protein [Myxococcota bacterium]
MSEAPVVQLGPISHIGIVVEDCEKAAAWWQRVFGVGPFSTDTYVLDESTHFRFKGEPARARMKASIAYSGKVFVELVEVLEGESPHTDFLRAHGEGLQHLAFSVENIEEVVAKLAPEGLRPILEYQFETTQGGRSFRVQEVYLNSAEYIGGSTVQLIEIVPL